MAKCRPHLEAISGAATLTTQLSLSARTESPFLPLSFLSPDTGHTSLSTSGLCLSPPCRVEPVSFPSPGPQRLPGALAWTQIVLCYSGKKGALRAREGALRDNCGVLTGAWAAEKRQGLFPPFLGSTLPHPPPRHSHEVPQASQSCPSPRTRLPLGHVGGRHLRECAELGVGVRRMWDVSSSGAKHSQLHARA